MDMQLVKQELKADIGTCRDVTYRSWDNAILTGWDHAESRYEDIDIDVDHLTCEENFIRDVHEAVMMTARVLGEGSINIGLEYMHTIPDRLEELMCEVCFHVFKSGWNTAASPESDDLPQSTTDLLNYWYQTSSLIREERYSEAADIIINSDWGSVNTTPAQRISFAMRNFTNG